MPKYAKALAAAMLLFMFLLMLGSSWNDSATFDEVAHVGAGYTYLKYRDSRLNPEHPPLLKDYAAFPLLFLNLKENITAQPFWTSENVNGRQWAAGNYLLYESGNNPDRILFCARLPIMLLALVFGWVFFKWVSAHFGAQTGLFSLFFFTVSPTFIAHSRFITTDLGASFGFFLGIVYFLKFLENPDKKSGLKFGLVLGMAMLFKFSLVLLLPVCVLLAIGKLWADGGENIFRKAAALFGKMALAGLFALLTIYAVYAYHVWDYQQDRQIADARYILGDYKIQYLAPTDFWLIEHNLTRPLGQYFYGFLMMARRTAGGNTAYFMGEISSKGWWSFFPVLAFLKEQLSFWVLAMLAVFYTAGCFKKTENSIENLRNWIKHNFALFGSVVFVVIYWVSSIANPLNIGVRHVMPTFPFIYLLTARGITGWLKSEKFENPSGFWDRFYLVYANYIRPAPKYAFLAFMFFIMALDMILSFPSYLSYYNVLGGGLRYGYKIATDSNYDWGQDLKRLSLWTAKNHIPKIYLDYFGGGSPPYYLGKRYQGWWSSFGPPPKGSYFAVSLNSLTGNQARPVGDITIRPEDTYPWLSGREPVTRAGSSILIYKF